MDSMTVERPQDHVTNMLKSEAAYLEQEIASLEQRTQPMRDRLARLQAALDALDGRVPAVPPRAHVKSHHARGANVAAGSKASALIGFVREAGRPVRVREIHNALVGKGRAFRSENGTGVACCELFKRGKLSRTAPGVYTVAEAA